MKILIILFGSLFLLFVSSCKSDDNGNNTVVIGEKYISEIITEVFNSADVQTDYLIKTYENNRPILDAYYNMDSLRTSFSEWTYSNNKLQSYVTYINSNTIVWWGTDIEYDLFDRIKFFYTYGDMTQRESYFRYNSDNTITKASIDVGSDIPADTIYNTYYLNELGLIYKEDRFQTEWIYDADNNLVSKLGINEDYTTNFSYNDAITPPEDFPIYDNGIFGSYSNNSILFGNRIFQTTNEASLAPKFIIESDRNSGSNYQWKWTFDNQNFPLTRIKSYNDASSSYSYRLESKYYYN
jgi:hypothetical protein